MADLILQRSFPRNLRRIISKEADGFQSEAPVYQISGFTHIVSIGRNGSDLENMRGGM